MPCLLLIALLGFEEYGPSPEGSGQGQLTLDRHCLDHQLDQHCLDHQQNQGLQNWGYLWTRGYRIIHITAFISYWRVILIWWFLQESSKVKESSLHVIWNIAFLLCGHKWFSVLSLSTTQYCEFLRKSTSLYMWNIIKIGSLVICIDTLEWQKVVIGSENSKVD